MTIPLEFFERLGRTFDRLNPPERRKPLEWVSAHPSAEDPRFWCWLHQRPVELPPCVYYAEGAELVSDFPDALLPLLKE